MRTSERGKAVDGQLLGASSGFKSGGLAHPVYRSPEPGAQTGLAVDVPLDDGHWCTSAGHGEVGPGLVASTKDGNRWA